MDKKRFTILLVDDYPQATRLLRNVLRGLGFLHIDEATNGPDALHMMREMPYDMVISDWNMEPMSGLDLLREMRTDPRFAETVFVMITGDPDADRFDAARKAGVVGFLAKPFSLDSVRKQISKIFDDLSAKNPG
jgi:two-component system, chemotaxis family, chemotaxis protein CheY